MLRLARIPLRMHIRTATIGSATACIHTTTCALMASASNSSSSARPRWTPYSFSRSRPSRHSAAQSIDTPPPPSQSRVGQRVDDTQIRPTFAVKRGSSTHATRSHAPSASPYSSPSSSKSDRVGISDADFSETEFEHHIQSMERKNPSKRRNAWDSVTHLESGGSEPGDHRRSAAGNEQQQQPRWNKSGRKSTHVPQPKNLRYTNRHEAPKRPHWLPDGVPYRMVAPSKEFEESWTKVLERYGAAPAERKK